jgi:lysophospholipase L1-like esterase
LVDVLTPDSIFNVVCAGNSITSGTGASAPETLNWPMVMRGLAFTTQASHPHTIWSVKNDGHSGESTTQLLARYPTQVAPQYNASYSTNILTFFEVLNDCIAGASFATALANVQAYVALARATGWRVLLLTVPKSTITTNGAQTSRAAFNDWLRATPSASDLAIVDIEPALGTPTGTPGDAFYTSDGTHPNDAGYALIAGMVRDRLMPLSS